MSLRASALGRRRSPKPRGLSSRPVAGPVTGLVAGLVVLALGGCPDRNRGVSPDGAGLFFPAGTVLDPRVPEGEPARWMFVLNANSDLVFNAGTLLPVDLDRFFGAWMRDARACFGEKDVNGDGAIDFRDGDPEACKPGRPPGSEKTGAWASWPVVGDVGDELTPTLRCRHNAQKPQVVECEDTYFLEEDAGVQLGNFGTALRGWIADVEDPDRDAKLLVAVRGDPSITVIDLQDDADDPDAPPVLRCGQGEDSGMYDPRRCAGDSLLRFIRNDPDGTRLDSEPTNILATPGDPQVLVTHSTRPQVTLIDLGGQYTREPVKLPNGVTPTCRGFGDDRVCKDGMPAIVHTPLIFELDGQFGGGWGLARRPCQPGTDNVPALTITRGPGGEPVECGRSLIYAGFRTNLVAARTFISEGQPLDRDYLDTLIEDLSSRIAALTEAIEAAVDPASKAALTAERADLQTELDRYIALREVPIPDDPGSLPPTPFDQRCLPSDEVSADELLDDDLLSPNTRGGFLCACTRPGPSAPPPSTSASAGRPTCSATSPSPGTATGCSRSRPRPARSPSSTPASTSAA